jgi:DNA-binding MarR family transcriptional regulator
MNKKRKPAVEWTELLKVLAENPGVTGVQFGKLTKCSRNLGTTRLTRLVDRGVATRKESTEAAGLVHHYYAIQVNNPAEGEDRMPITTLDILELIKKNPGKSSTELAVLIGMRPGSMSARLTDMMDKKTIRREDIATSGKRTNYIYFAPDAPSAARHTAPSMIEQLVSTAVAEMSAKIQDGVIDTVVENVSTEVILRVTKNVEAAAQGIADRAAAIIADGVTRAMGGVADSAVADLMERLRVAMGGSAASTPEEPGRPKEDRVVQRRPRIVLHLSKDEAGGRASVATERRDPPVGIKVIRPGSRPRTPAGYEGMVAELAQVQDAPAEAAPAPAPVPAPAPTAMASAMAAAASKAKPVPLMLNYEALRAAEAASKVPAAPAPYTPPPPVPEAVAKVEAELRDHMLEDAAPGSISDEVIVPAYVPYVKPELPAVPEQCKKAPGERPRVLVLGLRTNHVAAVNKDFSDCLEMTFYEHAPSAGTLVKRARRYADYVFVMEETCSPKVRNAIKSHPGYRLCNGSAGALKRILTDLCENGVRGAD